MGKGIQKPEIGDRKGRTTERCEALPEIPKERGESVAREEMQTI